MKRAQLIGIGIAVLAGGVAFVGMQGLINQPPPVITKTETVNATQVLVAKTDLGLGGLATEYSFHWVDWPESAVSPAFITRTSRPHAQRELKGSIARSPIIAGEPVTETKLIQAGKGGVLAAILPAGMRAVSTQITLESAVAKMILPNDHVDVILTQRKRGKNGAEEHVSDTLFRNVRVLAIGQQLETKEDQKGADGSVATLELTPAQAETLALANAMGEITLTLRSVADINNDKSADNANRKPEQGNTIKILRYGVKGRAYGVN